MAADSHPVFGLRDWSQQKWSEALAELGEADRDATEAFLDDFLLTTTAERHAEAARGRPVALQVKEMLGKALSSAQWRAVCSFQNMSLNGGREARPAEGKYYLDSQVLGNFIFDREFPLGVEDNIMAEEDGRHLFAVDHSGLVDVRHQPSAVTSAFVVCIMGSCMVAVIVYLLYLTLARDDLWDMEATLQDTNDPDYTNELNSRTKDRGTVASLFSALTFSLMINATLDKFGRIDPSTSTVLIGMCLGGTWGFVLDNLLGSDEGFREYLWAPQDGMKYALASLGTARFGRYLITIVFDMFFTVILFRLLYTKLLRLAGFSAVGREWIANGIVSTFISFITYQVYANMTRFEWAYPSGNEDLRNQWISGSTMVLAVVIMNMVYLVAETRTRVGEKGINDPPIKLLVTLCTFFGLFALNVSGVIDPSLDHVDEPVGNGTGVADPYDYSLPLKGVCKTRQRFGRGVAIFCLICVGSVAFVVLVTSRQTWSGLKHMVCRGPPPPSVTDPRYKADLRKGKAFMLCTSCCVIVLVVLFFSFVPIYHQSGERDTGEWQAACDANDVDALSAMGLS